jgi:hypothetical protein
MGGKTISARVIDNARARGAEVITRHQWGADMPDMNVYQLRRGTHAHAPLPSDTLWCHITVTDPSVGITNAMRALHRIGIERFGSGVSYNFAVHMRTGEIGVGMPLDAKGTHTIVDRDIYPESRLPRLSVDQNLVAHAVAFIGMPGMAPSDKAVKAYGTLVAAMIDESALTRGHDFFPHRLVAAKSCPTDAVVERMSDIHIFAIKHTQRKD